MDETISIFSTKFAEKIASLLNSALQITRTHDLDTIIDSGILKALDELQVLAISIKNIFNLLNYVTVTSDLKSASDNYKEAIQAIVYRQQMGLNPIINESIKEYILTANSLILSAIHTFYLNKEL
jgi:hypothetical protein